MSDRPCFVALPLEDARALYAFFAERWEILETSGRTHTAARALAGAIERAAPEDERPPATLLYARHVGDPLPVPGTPRDWQTRVREARTLAGRMGHIALQLSWEFEGRQITLDLNNTNIIAAVER